jgi:hypothetical protein
VYCPTTPLKASVTFSGAGVTEVTEVETLTIVCVLVVETVSVDTADSVRLTVAVVLRVRVTGTVCREVFVML